MRLNFSVKGLTGNAIINGRPISHSDYFLAFSPNEKRQFHFSIAFGAGPLFGNQRAEEFWLSAELPESIIVNQTVTSPLEGMDYLGYLKHETGFGADKDRKTKYLNDIKIKLTSDNETNILTASGRTQAEDSNGGEPWNYEISVEIREEILSILKNISKCSEKAA